MKAHEKRQVDEALEALRATLKKVTADEKKIAKLEEELALYQNELLEKSENPKNADEAGQVPALERKVQFVEGQIEKASNTAGRAISEFHQTFSDIAHFICTLYGQAFELAVEKHLPSILPLEPDAARARMIIRNTRASQNFVHSFSKWQYDWSSAHQRVDAIRGMIALLEDYATRDEKGTLADVF